MDLLFPFSSGSPLGINCEFMNNLDLSWSEDNIITFDLPIPSVKLLDWKGGGYTWV